MKDPFEVWPFLAGLGLFLYAISLAENSLKRLASRNFKILLRKHTNNHLKSIFVGTISTAILQSSSAVTLMLLALVGGGVITFSNALGIILGANLGTTFTGWIVSTFGFKVDINTAIYPMIAIGTLVHIFINHKKISLWGLFIASLGILFFGLNMMKQSMVGLQGAFDPAILAQYNILIFAFAGFVFTGIIQSSSATMVITLTALNAGLIPLKGAAALMIGADLGTTITVMVGAAVGSREKKKVAAAHFIFNLIIDTIALCFLPVFLKLAIAIVGVKEPLYALVLFYSGFNLFGIILFFPFLGRFSAFINDKIGDSKDIFPVLDIKPQHVDSAIISLHNESKKYIQKGILLNSYLLSPNDISNDSSIMIKELGGMSYNENYNNLKKIESVLINYSIKMQEQELTSEQSKELKQLVSGVRNCSLSVKGLKDIKHNLKEFKESTNDTINKIYQKVQKTYHCFYEGMSEQIGEGGKGVLFEDLESQLMSVEDFYGDFINHMNDLICQGKIQTKYLSSLFNTNREIYTSNRLIIFSIADIYLDEQEAYDLLHISHTDGRHRF